MRSLVLSAGRHALDVITSISRYDRRSNMFTKFFFPNQSITDTNKDERQCCVVINCFIRLLVILCSPFYCGLCYALVEHEIFPSYLSVCCAVTMEQASLKKVLLLWKEISKRGIPSFMSLPYTKHTWTNALLFFKIIHYILHTYVTDVLEFPDSICRQYFCLHLKPHMHCVLGHFCISKLPIFKQSVRAVMSWSCWMRSSTIMMQENDIFSAFYMLVHKLHDLWDHSGYGMCWSKADVQLLAISVTVNCLTAWTKTYSILSTIHKLDSLSGYIFDACSVILRISYQLLHLSSCTVIIFCKSVGIVTPDHKNWQHVAQHDAYHKLTDLYTLWLHKLHWI